MNKRVRLGVSRLVRTESTPVDSLDLEEHQAKYLLNLLSKARDRETMPHNQQTIDRVSDALVKAGA